jgi:hypothetical protein
MVGETPLEEGKPSENFRRRLFLLSQHPLPKEKVGTFR